MPVKELLSKMDSQELGEWWAYDLTKSPEFLERYKREKEAKQFAALSREEMKLKAMALFSNCGAVNRDKK